MNNRESTRWLGDINWRYKATRKVSPTTRVVEDFLEFQRCDVPVLLIQGDLDWSTPLENALDLKEYLPNSHIIKIQGGSHGTVRDAQRHFPDFPNNLYRFMANDFGKTKPKALFASLPSQIDLPTLLFKNPEKSFYEMFIDKGSQRDN